MPYTVQICINGREWLGRQLARERLVHTRADNCFPSFASPERVQEIMGRMLRLDWSAVLGNLVHRANPALAAVANAARADFYWTVHQAEWATDVMFADAATLARCYPSLVRHAVTDFHSPDVLRFLAKSPSVSYRGEATTDYKRRIEGVRVKRSAKANSVKMYDKAGSVLRVETTINQLSEFKTWRRLGGGIWVWLATVRRGLMGEDTEPVVRGGLRRPPDADSVLPVHENDGLGVRARCSVVDTEDVGARMIAHGGDVDGDAASVRAAPARRIATLTNAGIRDQDLGGFESWLLTAALAVFGSGEQSR